MHRLIMNSSTYRMASDFATPAHLEKDPTNLSLWRMNRRRLDAESLLDAMLSVSGRLDSRFGGSTTCFSSL